jgi:hypothetical protein
MATEFDWQVKDGWVYWGFEIGYSTTAMPHMWSAIMYGRPIGSNKAWMATALVPESATTPGLRQDVVAIELQQMLRDKVKADGVHP